MLGDIFDQTKQDFPNMVKRSSVFSYFQDDKALFVAYLSLFTLKRRMKGYSYNLKGSVVFMSI